MGGHGAARSRRVWVMGDPHIGHVSDDRDGAEWLRMSVDDAAGNVGSVDYVINVGDMTHRSLDEQLEAYVDIREASGMSPWFEMSGNHDMRSVFRGAYAAVVGCARYWTVVDGNTAFFSLPAERGNAAGLFVPEVESWLRERIAAHGDKNIVICAHQFPYGTVDRSTRSARCLYPRAAVERFLEDVQIDLWLGGHIHSGPRPRTASAVRNGTHFINVASVSHTYGTEACNSFVLDIEEGARSLRARCRDHDAGVFMDDHEVSVELTHAIRLGDDGPVFDGEDLEVAEFYRRIDEEQVDDFSRFARPDPDRR